MEFALVLPLLMALLVGIMTAGLAYNRVLGVADGVREGARFGATTLSSGSWGSTVKAQTRALTTLNVSGNNVVTDAMVCAQLVKAPSSVVQSSPCSLAPASVPATPTGVVAATCLVKVWAEIPVTFDLVILGSFTTTVRRQSVALYERGTC